MGTASRPWTHIRQRRTMKRAPTTRNWTRHIWYRAEVARTTWKLRLGALAALILGLWLTSGWWSLTIARSLVCDSSLVPSDAVLVDNLDDDYLLFERAAKLRQAGMAARVLVPVWADSVTQQPKGVPFGTTEVMVEISRVGHVEIVPIVEVEPITLNAARAIQRYLDREHIRSVIVVTPLFRSRRSELVYSATFGRAGIAVSCEPVQGLVGVGDWARSWHGIQRVLEQWFKLQDHRMYVLPFGLDGDERAAAR